MLSWRPVTGAVVYRVQISSSPGFETLLYNVDTEATAATPPVDLPTGTLHWRVASMENRWTVGAFAGSTFVKQRLSAPVPSSPPSGAELDYPGQPPTFFWSAVGGARSYQLEIDDAPDFVGAQVHTTANTSFALTEPQPPGQTWYWRVQARSGVTQLNSAFSPTRSYRVTWTGDKPTLTKPSHLAVVEEVVFEWTAVDGAADYLLQVSPNGDWSNNVVHTATVKSTRYSPRVTLDNGSYYWRVRARDAGASANSGRWSDEREFTRGWDARPEALHPVSGAVAEPSLRWSPVHLAASYEVQIGTDVNFSDGTFGRCYTNHPTWTPYARLSPWSGHGEHGDCTLVTHSVHRLEPGRTYYWRVRGIDTAGGVLGLWSNTGGGDVASFTYLPGTPEPLEPSDGATVSAPTLRWSPVPGHGRYRVTIIGTRGGWPTWVDTNAASFTPLTKLNPDHGPFNWYVQAIDANGKVGTVPPASAWRTFSLEAPSHTATHPTPLAPVLDAHSIRSPAMSWTPVAGADHYKVFAGVKGSGVVFTLNGASKLPYAAFTYAGTSPTVGDAFGASLPPAAYEWYVEAYNSSGSPIATGPAASFVIDSLSDAVTTTPMTGALQADTPTLSWKSVPDAGGYIVYVAKDANFTNEYRRYWTIYPTLTPRESYLDTQAGESYYWFVRPCWQGSTSPCGPFNTDDHQRAGVFRKRSVPVRLVAPVEGAARSNQPTFTWEPYQASSRAAGVSQEARSYRIQVSTVDTFSTLIDQQEIDQTTYTPSDRTYPEGPLHWRVQAIDGSGNALTWSEHRTLTKSSAPPVLQTPADGAVVSGVPALRWTPQPFAASYDVEVYRNGDLNFSPSNRAVAKLTKMAAYTPDTSLGGGTFVWRVRRRDADGKLGQWSAGRTFTLAPAAPPLIAPAQGSSVVGGLPLLQWGTVAEATSYRVEVSRAADFSTLVERQQTVMPAWIPLRAYAEGTYFWRVFVLDAAGNVLKSSAVGSFSVSAPPPSPPPTSPPPPPPPPPPTDPGPGEPQPVDPSGTSRRLADSTDPVVAAVRLSQAVFPDGSARHVILGRDDVFADSLAGAPLAGKDGPILYTTGGSDAPLRGETQAEIARALGGPRACGNGAQVLILGGVGAVSSRVEDSVRSMGYCIKRYGGASRVETSVQIAEDVLARTGSKQVLVARSHEWADAATGGAYAAAAGSPIVVTGTGQLHKAVENLLGARRPTDIVLLGGTAALSADVEAAAARLGPTRRVSGAARDATATAIAEHLWGGLVPRGVTLVNGYHVSGWAYALAAAVPAAREGAVQVYVQPDTISGSTQRFLSSHGYRFAIAAGPTSLISDGVHQAVIAGATAP